MFVHLSSKHLLNHVKGSFIARLLELVLTKSGKSHDQYEVNGVKLGLNG